MALFLAVAAVVIAVLVSGFLAMYLDVWRDVKAPQVYWLLGLIPTLTAIVAAGVVRV